MRKVVSAPRKTENRESESVNSSVSGNPQKLKCPQCGSNRLWRAGKYKKRQRFLCRFCGYRFSEFVIKGDVTSEDFKVFDSGSDLAQRSVGDRKLSSEKFLNNSSFSIAKDFRVHNVTKLGKSLNSLCSKSSNHRICAPETKAAENLVEVEIRTENRASAVPTSEVKSELINFSWYLKKLGRAEETIRTYANYVKNIAKLADLSNPEDVKGVIAIHYTNKNSKRMATHSYDIYLKFKGGNWEKPNYVPEHKQVFIPSDEELRLAINCGHKESFVFVKFLYETGARCNEAQRLEWTDLDPESNQVSIKASKNGNARTLPISKDLMNLLNSLPKHDGQQTVFVKKPSNTRSSSFHNRMERLAKIHNNPRFLKIHIHSFRHCKALRVYHNSHEILEVMEVLGHRKIETSYRYIRLYRQVYKNRQPKTFITKIATTEEEALWFWDNGWTLEDKEGNKRYFRKPKGC
jgi:integrase/predicted RNA-binding Zn-ribbon protein involved in translation (DUF1610 family)